MQPNTREDLENSMPEQGVEEDRAEALQRVLEEERNRHLRTLADFDNYRKRAEREAKESAVRGKKALVTDLLAVLDNLERAMAQEADGEKRQGLKMIYKQFLKALGVHGFNQMECLGSLFNPEEHEGIGYVAGTGYSPGCVAEELRHGYRFGEELLRPAAVRVAKVGD